MSLQQLFTSRKVYDAATFVAGAGKLFYDEATGQMRIGDGSTLGGHFVIPATATTSTIGGIRPGTSFTVSNTGTLNLNVGPVFYFDSTGLRLRAGTDIQIGGVKSGNGVIISSDGSINIDTEGLSFAFGDFFASTATVDLSTVAVLSSVNLNQDIVLNTNGTGKIQTIGTFDVHRTNGSVAGALAVKPIFSVKADGQIRMLVPLADTTAGALEIVGGASGEMFPPDQTGVILHVTGNTGLVNRNYFDSVDNYTVLTGRRYNGTATSPTGVLNNQVILRIVGQAMLSNSTLGTFGPARLEFRTTQDQAVGAQGGEAAIFATANGTAASASGVEVAKFNATTGVTSTVGFVGPLTGNVTGTATTATNLSVATTLIAGQVSVAFGQINKNVSAATATATITGLTASHKIVVTPDSAMTAGIIITAAYYSSANTVTVQAVNVSGANITPAAFNLNYFAWV